MLGIESFLVEVVSSNTDVASARADFQKAGAAYYEQVYHYAPSFSLSFGVGRRDEPNVSQLFPSKPVDSSSLAPSLKLMLPGGGVLSAEFSSAYTKTEPFTIPGFPPPAEESYTKKLSVSYMQPLLKNFLFPSADILALRIAYISWRASYFSYVSSVTRVAFQAGSLYFEYLKALAEEESSRRALERAQRRFEKVNENKAMGISDEADVLVAQALLELAQVSWRMAKSRKENIKRQLILLGGEKIEKFLPKNWEQAKSFLENLRFESLRDFDQCVAYALTHRPELQQLKLSKEMQRLKLKIAKSSLLPDLSFTASYTLYGNAIEESDAFEQVRNAEHKSWNVGLLLQIPLPPGEAWHSLRAERLELKKLEDQISQLEKSIKFEVREAYDNYQNLLKNLENYNQAKTFYLKKFEREKERYQMALIPYSAFLGAEDEKDKFEFDYFKTVTSVAVAWLQLQKATGRLAQEILEEER